MRPTCRRRVAEATGKSGSELEEGSGHRLRGPPTSQLRAPKYHRLTCTLVSRSVRLLRPLSSRCWAGERFGMMAAIDARALVESDVSS